MPKKGQHERDVRDSRISRGPNKPKKAMTITTGTYKKRETYEEQARQHKNTDPEPQRKVFAWIQDTREWPPEHLRIDSPASRRSGSDSNASRRTRGH